MESKCRQGAEMNPSQISQPSKGKSKNAATRDRKVVTFVPREVQHSFLSLLYVHERTYTKAKALCDLDEEAAARLLREDRRREMERAERMGYLRAQSDNRGRGEAA
jgi:hypothetical protein